VDALNERMSFEKRHSRQPIGTTEGDKTAQKKENSRLSRAGARDEDSLRNEEKTWARVIVDHAGPPGSEGEGIGKCSFLRSSKSWEVELAGERAC